MKSSLIFDLNGLSAHYPFILNPPAAWNIAIDCLGAIGTDDHHDEKGAREYCAHIYLEAPEILDLLEPQEHGVK